MSLKKIFVDMDSFRGEDEKNPIGNALHAIARTFGEICLSVEEADIAIVGSPQAAMKALSASTTGKVIFVAVTRSWKDDLVVGTNLRKSHPDRFAVYALLAVPEIAVESVEELFDNFRH